LENLYHSRASPSGAFSPTDEFSNDIDGSVMSRQSRYDEAERMDRQALK